MPTPYANVKTANMIGGAATSFQVDSTEIGGTNGGVELQRQQKFTGFSVDQVPGDVADLITGDDITIKTSMSEVTLANMKFAWNSSTAVTTTTTPAGVTTGMGVESGLAKEHTLTIVGPAPAQTGSYTARTYTVHKAISYATGQAFKHEKTGEILFPITFKLHPDLTQTAGEEYMTIADA